MEKAPSHYPEKRSAINRIVGFPELEEGELLTRAKDAFENQETYPFEREKTWRESQIIEGVLPKLQEFLGEYGAEPLALTPDHVHVADESAMTADRKAAFGIPDEAGGLYIEDRQGAVVFASEDDLLFSGRVVHEAIHANSFSSFERSGEGISQRRMGLAVLSPEGRRYFHDLNEGLTEELTKRFDRKYSKEIPPLMEAEKTRKEFVDAVRTSNPRANVDDVRSVITKQEADGGWKTTVAEYVYSKERKKLLEIVNTLYEKNRDRFNSPEEVFKLFVRSAFTGRIIELGELIERSFGEGSFRTLGEETEKNA